jgi:hypothetical protein
MPYPYASTVSSGTAGPYAHGTGTGIGTGTRTVPVPGTVPVPVPTRVLSPTVDDAPRLILDLPRAPPRLWHAEAPFLEPRGPLCSTSSIHGEVEGEEAPRVHGP